MEDSLTATAYLLAPDVERRRAITDEVVKGMFLFFLLLEGFRGSARGGSQRVGREVFSRGTG